MVKPKIYVLTGCGINCEEETFAAYQGVGAAPVYVSVHSLLSGVAPLSEASLIHLSGGFSFGDDLGAGTVLASKLRRARMNSGQLFFDALCTYIQKGGKLFGVCNGFQVLVKAGLLPNLSGTFEREVTLASNGSGWFEDRWVFCRANTGVFKREESFFLPVRHSEGRLVTAGSHISSQLQEKKLICLHYVEKNGVDASTYPANPNGSALNIAGLTDLTGRVVGMMPHPEACLTPYSSPNWPWLFANEKSRFSGDGCDGFWMFRKLVSSLHS